MEIPYGTNVLFPNKNSSVSAEVFSEIVSFEVNASLG